MQIDGYSLDAQKSRMKAFAEFNDYEIAHEYEDAGKSGKSIEGRTQFNQMMEDIKTGKDGVSFVLVFKLSRFGRNAADVLSTLQVMQDFGVNLICVEDGIDSSKDAGKLMISVLSAVAEIERENIRVQTMEGRIQKAREGKWNGGFAPYGYKLVDGKLEINEEEAPAIRTIYEQYVTTDSGANRIAKYLENHGISKVQRQNGKNPLFDARLIRMILKNPVYCGKIAYGRRKTEKVHGTRNEYRLVEQENFLLVDGLHEAIIPEDVWQAAQVKLAAQAKRYEHVNKGKNECTHLLSGIVKCPICGVGMYGNKCVKRKADGSKYKDFYYYGCKHRSMTRGHKCDYKKQIRKELLDDAVAEVICKLVSNPKFAAMMQEKINMKVDTTAIEQEISNYEKQLRQAYSTKSKLIEEIDSLDPDDRHYSRRKSDLDDRLYGMYDKIEELESLLIAARAKKQAIEAEKLTGDNIYKVLIYFDQLYGKMNDREKRQLIEELISEIQIYPERQPNGQWLKSIKFRLPIIEEDMNISLDNEQQVDVVLQDLMERGIKVAGGDRLGKTIIFAQNKRHAEFIVERFNKLYPQYRGSFAQRVICDDSYAQTVIDDFKRPEKEPHIAVSVDMMDTGIDVPECVNLVFFKKVRSKAKFWQMIGRGSRLCRGLSCVDQVDGAYTDKRRFLIFDYCGNFEYFREHKEGYEARETKTLSENIFGKRIKLAMALQESAFDEETYQAWRNELVATCHKQVTALNRELISVKLRRRYVEKYRKREAFLSISESDKGELLTQIAPLVQSEETDEWAKRFDNFMYGLILAHIEGTPAFKYAKKRLCETASLLERKANIPQIKEKLPLLREIHSDLFWNANDILLFEKARRELRGLIRFLDENDGGPKGIITKLTDPIIDSQEGVQLETAYDFEDYRSKVNRYVNEHGDTLAIYKLTHNIPLARGDYQELERVLTSELGSQEDYKREFGDTPFGLLIRKIAKLDHEAAMQAFSAFINDQSLNQKQIAFVKKIINHLELNGYMENVADLTKPPFDKPISFIKLFDAHTRRALIAAINQIRENAVQIGA